MKKALLFLLSLASLPASLLAQAQGALSVSPQILAKMDTSKPVQFKADAVVYDDGSLFEGWSKKQFKKEGFTDEEINVLMFWMKAQNFPPAIRYITMRKPYAPLFPYYRAYAVGKTGAIWIPKDKNSHMPVEMQPLGAEGMLVTAANKAWNSEISSAGKAPPAALVAQIFGTPPGAASSGVTASGVQYSTADMSGATRTLGAMIIYYGVKAQYGKEAQTEDYYIYQVIGTGEVSDKAGLGGILAKKVLTTREYIGYEWLAGYDCNSAKGYARRKSGLERSWGCSSVTPTGSPAQ